MDFEPCFEPNQTQNHSQAKLIIIVKLGDDNGNFANQVRDRQPSNEVARRLHRLHFEIAHLFAPHAPRVVKICPPQAHHRFQGRSRAMWRGAAKWSRLHRTGAILDCAPAIVDRAPAFTSHEDKSIKSRFLATESSSFILYFFSF